MKKTINNFCRNTLGLYRKFQNRVFGRHEYGQMPKGVECNVEKFKYDENHGDVVHPCVRFVKEGFEGHKWWMVYTPYYKADASLENPILCYSDNDEGVPPTEWHFYCEVCSKPGKGYNSDPNILFNDGNLYVFWRENETLETAKRGYCRATFCGMIKNGKVVKINEPLLFTSDEEEDAEVSPTFLKRDDDEYVAYAMHLKFHSKFIRRQSMLIRKLLERIALIFDLVGIWSQQKYFGYAIWKGANLNNKMERSETVKFNNCNKLWRPWHMDLFEHKGRLYAIVQTNQCNADLALAYSDDGRNFTFFNKPLLTNNNINMLGLYKPTGGVTDNGQFYLYYTAQAPENRSLNKLFLTTIDFEQLQKKLQ